jgi:hypothetical protein
MAKLSASVRSADVIRELRVSIDLNGHIPTAEEVSELRKLTACIARHCRSNRYSFNDRGVLDTGVGK